MAGFYVTPGLVDIHAHVYAGTGERSSYAGDLSVYPDAFTFRSGVTTAVDAGSSGWRNFEDFKDRVIDRSKTRVLAFLNIVGNGMRGGRFENDLADMEAAPAAEMALATQGTDRGDQDRALCRARVDAGGARGGGGHDRQDSGYGRFRLRPPGAPTRSNCSPAKLRPGDIYTHCYSGLRHELDDSGKVNPGMIEGRKRGVIFDVGHGNGSFAWRVAVPALKQGFLPDSISTDLHIGSMNSSMKDMLNVMDKFLAMGLSLDEVIRAFHLESSAGNPARRARQSIRRRSRRCRCPESRDR